MSFILNADTKITNPFTSKPIVNAVNILKRDMKKTLSEKAASNEIVLAADNSVCEEGYSINITSDKIRILANDDLGFVYGLLHISEKYLKIKPFWFWMDQEIKDIGSAQIPDGEYVSPKPAVRFRGWFFNDEVLMLKWKINGDEKEPWRMAFEALLRCGGNITVPGTDKSARANRQMAADMGLWITHHHAEPLGAEMFMRAYPDKTATFTENEQLFYKLWEDAVIEQKDCKVVWNLCFRGQGDKPFWADDTSGKYDTPKKCGEMISEMIERQCSIVKKYVKDPVFCTNLYGEIMELYNQGYVKFSSDIIKVYADNGFGKMVTRRRGNHSVRVPSMPRRGEGEQGIYYHVSFYDLQAANHITMLPNSVDFVNRELSSVLENDGGEFWVINCSNVRPHTYYLDAVRKKWFGENITDKSHSVEFAKEYFGGSSEIAKLLCERPDFMVSYGENEDEHAGEQFYTENSRLIAHHIIVNADGNMSGLRWVAGDVPFGEQVKKICGMCADGVAGFKNYLDRCVKQSESMGGKGKELFDGTILLQAQIHYLCSDAMRLLGETYANLEAREYKKAFLLAGLGAERFEEANLNMRESERGVWQGFYYNDCFADIKHSAYMMRKLMGYIRELGDNPSHDRWYRDTMYAPEDKNIALLLVLDNHMTDEELYEAMKKEKADF